MSQDATYRYRTVQDNVGRVTGRVALINDATRGESFQIHFAVQLRKARIIHPAKFEEE